MRISHFFIDRPIFAARRLDRVHHPGRRRLRAPAGRAISGNRAADHQRHRPISRRQRRSRRLDRGRADRGADQRRREHALHVLELDRRRPLLASRSRSISAPISISRRCRCRTASRIAQPRLPQDVRTDRRHGGQELARPDDGRAPVIRRTSRATRCSSRTTRTLEIKDALTRVDGVGSITVFGSRDYSMRIWLDPRPAAVART